MPALLPCALSAACSRAMSAAPTRFICPAPTPNVIDSSANDNRIGFNMFDDFPTKFQGFPVLLLSAVVSSRLRISASSYPICIRLLDEQSAFDDVTVFHFSTAFCFKSASSTNGYFSFCRVSSSASSVNAWRNDDFKENLRSIAGCFDIDFTVQGDDAAENRCRIRFICFLIRF